MGSQRPTYPAILVLTGASGAGKTTLIEELIERAIPRIKGINCDRVKIDLPETAEPRDAQAEVLRYWISKLGEENDSVELAVLDTQIRPHAAQAVLYGAGVKHWQVVLVNCDHPRRNERLIKNRKQPDLANPQMDCWAAYLRGQADALGLAIIHTDDAPPDESFETLESLISDLLRRARTAP
jgi:dephospho-CoA kinase